MRSHRLVRILKAAVTLAVLYSLGVVVLLALVTVFDGWDLTYGDLRSIAAPFAILFGGAFLVLAVARRLGIVLLWLVLVSLWLAMFFAGGINDSFELLSRGIVYPYGFVLWSTLALPLFAMSAMAGGRGALLKIGPWSVSGFFTVGVLWLLLAVGGVILRNYAHPHFAWTSMSAAITFAALGWILWAPMPFVIAAVSVRRFWIASRAGELVDAAA